MLDGFLRPAPFLALALAFLTGAPLVRAEDAPGSDTADKLVIAGDSTACEYESTMTYRGWGMFLQPFFKPNLQVINLARPGRSLSTFALDRLWNKALDAKPKFILIQFGTNEAGFNGARASLDPDVGYRKFLNRYIDGALANGSIPILISPTHPRTFGANGKLEDWLGLDEYTGTMRRVAKERGVAMIDLFTESKKLFEQVGPEGCLQFDPLPTDKVHFNALSAKAMAQMVARRLPKVEPRIAPYMAAQDGSAGKLELGFGPR